MLEVYLSIWCGEVGKTWTCSFSCWTQQDANNSYIEWCALCSWESGSSELRRSALTPLHSLSAVCSLNGLRTYRLAPVWSFGPMQARGERLANVLLLPGSAWKKAKLGATQQSLARIVSGWPENVLVSLDLQLCASDIRSGGSERGRCRRGRSEIPHLPSKLHLFALFIGENGEKQKNTKKRRKTKKAKWRKWGKALRPHLHQPHLEPPKYRRFQKITCQLNQRAIGVDF